MADELEYPLHECIFNGDLRRLSALLRSHDIAKKDKHGNGIRMKLAGYPVINLQFD